MSERDYEESGPSPGESDFLNWNKKEQIRCFYKMLVVPNAVRYEVTEFSLKESEKFST